MKYYAFVSVIVIIIFSFFYFNKNIEYNKTVKDQNTIELTHKIIDSLNICTSSDLKSELSGIEKSTKEHPIIIIVSSNICTACLINELMTIKSTLGIDQNIISIVDFRNSKNIEIFNKKNQITNNNILINNDIVQQFSNFSVPIIYYNGFLFIPQKDNKTFSLRFYKLIRTNI